MSLLVEEHLSAYLCGYRKGFSTKQALLSLLERRENVLDKKGYGGAVLMGLSKTFGTFLNHALLIGQSYMFIASQKKGVFNK